MKNVSVEELIAKIKEGQKVFSDLTIVDDTFYGHVFPHNVSFIGCHLQNVSFHDCITLHGMTFENCDLDNVLFCDSLEMPELRFIGGVAKNLVIDKVSALDSEFVNILLQNVNFTNSILTRSSFSRVRFAGGNFRGTYFTNTIFESITGGASVDASRAMNIYPVFEVFFKDSEKKIQKR